MKKAVLIIPVVLLLTGLRCAAQGPLTPPNPPGPTMASLQEIWDAINAQESQIESL